MSARDTYVTKNIRNVKPEIREAILAEVEERRCTISDVVGGVLSAAWDIEYVPSGWRAIGIGTVVEREQLNVFIPQEMAQRTWIISRSRGITESSLIQSVLAEHYGIDYEPVRRGGERRRASA
jgi:hypothetical protein